MTKDCYLLSSGMSTKAQEYHHNLTTVLSREEKCVSKLTATIASYTNPFTQQGQDLFNLITIVVMPEELKRDLCAQSAEGAKLLNTFVAERIQSYVYVFCFFLRVLKAA